MFVTLARRRSSPSSRRELEYTANPPRWLCLGVQGDFPRERVKRAREESAWLRLSSSTQAIRLTDGCDDLCRPMDGDYYFHLATDDEGHLYLLRST